MAMDPHEGDSASALTFWFAESQPISTYLVAFAAGPWSVKSAVIGGRPISLYVRAHARARSNRTRYSR